MGLKAGSALQVVAAISMTKHRGLLAMVKEVALVLLCLKPGFDVWYLAHGAEHDPGAPADPKAAMMFGKVAERVFETIPGSILTAVRCLTTPTRARCRRWRRSSLRASRRRSSRRPSRTIRTPTLRGGTSTRRSTGNRPSAPLGLRVLSRSTRVGSASIHPQVHGQHARD
jgi:hypothetical protein